MHGQGGRRRQGRIWLAPAADPTTGLWRRDAREEWRAHLVTASDGEPSFCGEKSGDRATAANS